MWERFKGVYSSSSKKEKRRGPPCLKGSAASKKKGGESFFLGEPNSRFLFWLLKKKRSCIGEEVLERQKRKVEEISKREKSRSGRVLFSLWLSKFQKGHKSFLVFRRKGRIYERRK